MNILEKEIEDIIFEALRTNPRTLQDRGLFLNPYMSFLRQVDLGSYGRADIIGFVVHPKKEGYRQIFVHILEIKKEQVNSQTLFQALRYARALQRFVSAKLKNTDVDIKISLIGKSIDAKCDFVYLSDFTPNIAYYTYTVDLYQGVRFERHWRYFLSDERLPDAQQFADETKLLLSLEIFKQQEEMPF